MYFLSRLHSSTYKHMYNYTFLSQRRHPLFANSSCSVSVMDVKLGLITWCCTGSVIRGRLKTRYGQEERCTGCHCYGNRCHAFRAFTDGECEILDTLLCVKQAVQCPRGDARDLWHARYLGGPLCTNKLYTEKLHVLWFAQVKLSDSQLQLHIPGIMLFVVGQELYSQLPNAFGGLHRQYTYIYATCTVYIHACAWELRSFTTLVGTYHTYIFSYPGKQVDQLLLSSLHCILYMCTYTPIIKIYVISQQY